MKFSSLYGQGTIHRCGKFCCKNLGLFIISFLFASLVHGQTDARLPEIANDAAVISSPRTTFESFIRLTDSVHELIREEGVTLQNQTRLRNLYQQIKKLFDLDEIPPKYRTHVAVETAVYLREALARFPVIPLDEVPDEEAMVDLVQSGRAALYRLPQTQAVISRQLEGYYTGRYQFSAASVSDARGWFEAVRVYPYYPGQESVASFHDDYFLSPGPLISVDLIRSLPPWMQTQHFDQAVWQWLLLIITVLVLAALLLLSHWLIRRLTQRQSKLVQGLAFALWGGGVLYVTAAARTFLEQQVILSGEVLQDVLFGAKVMMLLMTVFILMKLASVLSELVVRSRRFRTRQIDQQLISLGIRMASILFAVVIVIEGMQQIGFSLATLVAGAGVTGLAIALAAQDTLKNVFGGLLLALDKPFEVGQRVMIKGYEGFIQEVGLRSTRVRTLAGHQIIIPNDEAARLEVENIGRRPFIRRDMNITITYDTPPAKIVRAVEILKEILSVPDSFEGAGGEKHPNEAINRPGFLPRVYFSELNADSLNLLVAYWFHPPDHWTSVEFAHGVNLKIMERFNEEGIEFAFPSQTMYLAGDNKRPLGFSGDNSSPGGQV